MSTVPPPERPDDDASREASSSISDEQLDAFLRESTGGGGAPAPKEPSARARMVAARLREQDEAARRAQGSRSPGRWPRRKRKAQGPPPGTPPGWRTGPAWQEMNGTASRRRRIGAVVGVSLALALAVVAVRPSLLLDRIPGPETEAAADGASPLPAETALPTAAPGEVDAVLPTLAHPFRGSPAARWADGADAIELPEAKAVAGLTEADVKLALRRTKEFLVAANLDPEVIGGGQPDRALELLDPKAPAMLTQLRRSLRDPTRNDDPVGLFSRFDPKQVQLAGDVVRVRGHMSFAAGRPGEVKVHADYSFVYPLVRAGGDDDRVARTVVRRGLTLTLADPRKWIATQGKLIVEEYVVDTFNNECDVYDGYLHPVFPGADPTGAPPTGPAKDPYDRRQSLADVEHQGCGKVTRT
ncbi:hypothetical protein [Streptomyces poriticola]|uniref:hypothetical protein n=1 Tax=Streptomyces poriticola TaxID=3120506 RepID=UPI002FCDFE00